MQTRQGNTAQALRAVQVFLDEHAAKYPALSTSGARKKMDAAIAEIAAHATDQEGGTMSAQSNTKRASALRGVLLRNYMGPISRIARAELPDTQELRPLRVPRGNPTVEKVAVAARAMAQVAALHTPVFVDAGLPTDFIARLNVATDAMLQAVDDKTKNRGRAKGATAGLRESIRNAQNGVRILDSFVRVALADEPALLGAWNRIKAVRRASVRALSAGPATSTPQISAA